MKIKNLLIIVLLFFIQISDAKENKSFKKLQKMQISALDFYLYTLYTETRCNTWLEHRDGVPSLCMVSPPRIKDNSDIELNFSIHNYDEEYLKESREYFENASDAQKTANIKMTYEDILNFLGLNKGRTTKYGSGLVNNIYLPEKINKSLKEEIKDHMKVNLFFTYGKDMEYSVKRNSKGEIIIKKIIRLIDIH